MVQKYAKSIKLLQRQMRSLEEAALPDCRRRPALSWQTSPHNPVLHPGIWMLLHQTAAPLAHHVPCQETVGPHPQSTVLCSLHRLVVVT